MLPTFVEDKSAYEFAQSLELTTRETAQTPAVKTRARQQGFLFVESLAQGTPPTRVSRFVTQNLLSPASLARLYTLPHAPRKPLAEEHLQLYFSLQRPFGLELPFEFTTDLLGGNATPAADPGRPGKPRPALPFDVLHFPFATPALSNDDPAVGKTWKAFIMVRCGFGNFTLPYSARWTARDIVAATAEMTFDPPTPPEKPALLNGIQLFFRPAGKWTATFAVVDGRPLSARGQLQYRVQAEVPAERTSTEVLNAQLDFQWRHVPVGFTPQMLLTETWAMLPRMA